MYKQSNAGGLVDTWLYQVLCGTGSGASYIFYTDGGDGTYTHYEYSYPGYQIRKPDTDEEETAGAVLSLQRTQKYISDGYRAENDAANRAFYTGKYLNRPKGKESALVQLRPTKSTLWFPSEQELIAYSIEDARGETGNMPRSIYLKSESQIPELADSWRSSESYWLRSTPSAYLATEDYDDLGMGTTASTRDEYFLIADSSGIADVAHYDDTAAVRLMFTVK